ncbi:TPA: secretoglobin family protein [Escherichia coli]|nr:secretoglobin family protein [Escherichia coli]
MNNSPLLNHYQAWLDDFTRVSLFHSLCQQHIIQWHRLAITASLMPDGSVTECVIPQCLLPVTRTDQLGSCSAIPGLTKHTDYSLLPGVLLSECYRLGKSRLAEQLQLLFRQYPQPGIRESLTLLCWCELATGKNMGEWYELHLPLPYTLKRWLAVKQLTYRGLKTLTDDYIRATRPL